MYEDSGDQKMRSRQTVARQTKKIPFQKIGFSRRQLLIFVLVFGIVGGPVVLKSFAAGPTPDGSWENGMGTFTNLECPNPATQFARVTSPVRAGNYAARFHETGADIWAGNSFVRCLAADYNSGETTGDEFYYSLSVYIPSPGLSSNLLWELHHPASLYNQPGCSVAPFAINSNGTGMTFRIATGNCTVGAGYSYWNPNITIPNLTTQPQNTWIDFVIHIKFTESNTGVVEVYDRIGNGAWSQQINRTGIPTMPYCDSCGVHNVKLYTEMGLYTGRSGYSGSDTVYLDDYRRETTLAAAQGGAGAPPAPPPPVPAPSPSSTAKPYFRAYGADTFSGGWFNSGASSCSPAASTFQAPTYSGPSNLYRGGVMAYAKSNGSGGGSQFGALALGLIEGNNDPNNPYGFTSGSSGYNRLSFANFSSLSANNFWGGFWEGSDVHQASHCLPDYFGTKQNSPKAWSGSLSSAASGQYIANGLTLNTSPEVIPAGKNVTLFVNGDVYIGNNITYAPGFVADNVPKFALVARGNIFIDPAVSRLDGLYIAQPNTTNTASINGSGVIWTCHANGSDPPTVLYVSSACRTKLTFNGAVVAKQVNLLRVSGDIAGATAGEGSGSGNIAEVFNFTPEMVIGGGFFNGGNDNRYKIESLISLPPVF